MSPDLIERLSQSRARLALSLASVGAPRKGETFAVTGGQTFTVDSLVSADQAKKLQEAGV